MRIFRDDVDCAGGYFSMKKVFVLMFRFLFGGFCIAWAIIYDGLGVWWAIAGDCDDESC